MTREEIIKGLNAVNKECGERFDESFAWMAEIFQEATQALEQKPCEDAISRQAVLDLFKQIKEEYPKIYTAVEVSIRMLPSCSENPNRSGKWIEQDGYDGDVYYDCSVCGESWTTIDGTPWENGMKYCPHCGARMGG